MVHGVRCRWGAGIAAGMYRIRWTLTSHGRCGILSRSVGNFTQEEGWHNREDGYLDWFWDGISRSRNDKGGLNEEVCMFGLRYCHLHDPASGVLRATRSYNHH